MRLTLPPFDPSKEFVTQTAFRAAGVAWGKGFVFDKDSVSTRILGLLYSQRKIIYADDPRAEKLLSRFGTGRAAPVQLTEDEQIRRLEGRYNKLDLQKRAKDLDGYTARMTKPELAALLVRNGRGDS